MTPLPSRTAARRSPRSLPLPAQAALNVVACEPEWGALAKELGGDKVNVSSTTTALQDPHHIEARPSLIARMRERRPARLHRARARGRLAAAPDPAVGQPEDRGRARRATSRRAASSRRSRCRPRSTAATATSTPAATRTSSSTRATSPRSRPRWRRGSRRSMRPTRATYQQRLAAFSTRWSAAIAQWEQQAQPLRGRAGRRAAQELDATCWSWLGVREVATLEPKPGVEPSAGYLATLKRAARAAAGEDGRARRLRGPARVAVARRSTPASRPSCCRSRSAATTRRRTCSASSTTASRCCSARGRRSELVARSTRRSCCRRSSPACWCWRRTCRSASQVLRAASSSSTSRSRRSPASA